MDKNAEFILWFDQVGIEDVPLVGGKNASLGEMYRLLTQKGVRIPNGFCVTANAYKYFIEKTGTKEKINQILKTLNTADINSLAEHGKKIRNAILEAELPQDLKDAIAEGYRHVCIQYGENADVAVRSSATAEDLPDASFAGQQETYLNITGVPALLDACKRCFASLFTNRAISYRADKGFDHFKVLLSIGVQKMVRSDLACSGVMFSIDTESGFPNVVLINAAYGLGENIVQGAVNPDEYYVFKPTLRQNFRPIIKKTIGNKEMRMIYSVEGTRPVKNVPVELEERKKFALTDDEILALARWAMIIEDHYSEKAGHFKPMDMEWAKDGKTNELFIVQARPETVQSQKNKSILEKYSLRAKGNELCKGKSVGERIGQGEANVIRDVKEISKFKKGQVLITEMTDPDWEPIMKIASAIVTNRGGRTCFTGDTKLLTNEGFMKINEIHCGLLTPSLNIETKKIEWKKITDVMKRKSNVIEISVGEKNKLKLTPDHKMLVLEDGQIAKKEIYKILLEKANLLLPCRVPVLVETANGIMEQELIINFGQKINENFSECKPVFEKEVGVTEVYNITVEDHHNYMVFTEQNTPIFVANCHAAIISRELGIPCVVGTGNSTEKVKQNQKITVDCSQGDDGFVYEGILRFDVEKIDLSQMPKPKTKIMINVGNPDEAFDLSFLPNEGVGLAREEFIVNSFIQAHPLALIHFDTLKDEEARKKIEELTYGYKSKPDFFVDKLAQGVSIIASAFYPKDVILRFSDFKTNEYANLIGGKQFEPVEDNPMIGWRGAARYYSDGYREGFALECRAIKKVRDEMGLTNLKVMIPMCRTIDEGKKVLAEMEKNGLKKGENNLQVYVMCEVPANVILADQFSDLFDGFSIGSNDLTQFTLAVDRDSELVAHIFNERNDAVKTLVAQVISVAKKRGRKIGICGDAPSTYPEFAEFLVEKGIDSISLSPDAVMKTAQKIYEKEKQMGR